MVAPVSVVWRGVTLDERTAAMMDEVAALSGDVYVRPTQGSYAGGGVQASAGTHDGCGAIDIAGQDEGMTQADREVIANAGRQVGFAMWIRNPDQSDWPWHIHGIAVQPGGQWDAGGLSSGGHGQVIDYYEGRNGLASGAPDDGPRDWVGVTWETYAPLEVAAPPKPPLREDDMPNILVTTDGAQKLVTAAGSTHLYSPEEVNACQRIIDAPAFDTVLQAEIDIYQAAVRRITDGITGP